MRLIAVTVLVVFLSSCLRVGHLNIEFKGVQPKSIIVSDFEMNLKSTSQFIKPFDYGHYMIEVLYTDGMVLKARLCHQNSWYKEEVEIERISTKDKQVVIKHTNQELKEIKNIILNVTKDLQLGACG